MVVFAAYHEVQMFELSRSLHEVREPRLAVDSGSACFGCVALHVGRQCCSACGDGTSGILHD